MEDLGGTDEADVYIDLKGGSMEKRLYKKELTIQKIWIGFCFGFWQLSSSLQNTGSADFQLLKNWEEQFFKR